MLVLVVYSFLFFELSKHLNQLTNDKFFDLNHFDWNLLIMAVLLMPVNWFTESLKWRFLIQRIEKVSRLDALKAVFAGTAISIFTPNRVGDYMGRVFILKKGDRLDGVVATVIGNLGQLLVTVLLGLFAVFYFLPEILTQYLNPSLWLTLILRIIIVILASGLFTLFITFPHLEKTFNLRFGLEKYPLIKHINFLSEFTQRQIVIVFLYSLIRYIIYSLQFFLLFQAFQIDLPVVQGFIMIFLIFFGITVIPTIAVAELGVRAVITIMVFKLLEPLQTQMAEISLINATSVLWLINIALAAFIGGLFIFNLRFFRKTDLVSADENSDEK